MSRADRPSGVRADLRLRFLSLAHQSRSAEELLSAVLGRPVGAERTSACQQAGTRSTRRSRPSEPPFWLAHYRLFDPAAPNSALAYASAVIIWPRLSLEHRVAARRPYTTISSVLAQSDAPWATETLLTEQLSSDASWSLESRPEPLLLRVTSQLFYGAEYVAMVIEEIPVPAGRGPPFPDASAARS